jgi:hypothetical protein
LARESVDDIVHVLRKILLDEEESALSRIAAAKVLLDRAYGAPATAPLPDSDLPNVTVNLGPDLTNEQWSEFFATRLRDRHGPPPDDDDPTTLQ